MNQLGRLEELSDVKGVNETLAKLGTFRFQAIAEQMHLVGVKGNLEEAKSNGHRSGD